MSTDTDTRHGCRICGSPDHVASSTSPICPDGFRVDYMPGKHDPWTGELIAR